MDPRQPNVIDALEQALNDTFEGITFSQVLERRILTETPDLDEDTLAAYIDMPEPISLSVLMVLGRDHARECFESVAADLDLDSLPPQVLVDFVQELCNTTAGHFNSILAPEKKDMTIGLPATCEGEALTARLTPDEHGIVLAFAVEEHQVLCALHPVD